MNLVKYLYSLILKCITRVAGIDAAKKFDAKLRFNRMLNLKNPSTLADKVSYLEIHNQQKETSKCSDKFEVRKFISEKKLNNILIPLLQGPYDNVDELDYSSLPDKFVIKATHGCKMNIIVDDKNKFDKLEAKKILNKWLKTTYGTYSMEPHYFSIPHRIIVEQFIESKGGIIDYKFHCFNGKPQFVLVCNDRFVDDNRNMNVYLSIYDLNWNKINEIVPYKNEIPSNKVIKKPQNLTRMIEIAELLSLDFKFVRVDLYEIDGNVFFGELTFSPACGVFPYFSDKFNNEMGKLLII